MEEKQEKYSWKEVLQLSFRGYREIFRLQPKLIPSMILYFGCTALMPFLTIWLSAQIINELAYSRRPEVLWPLVAVTVAAIGLTTLVKGASLRWYYAEYSKFEDQRIRAFADKRLDMDYVEVEKIENRDLLSQIMQNENWHGWGLSELMFTVENLTRGILGIGGAVALTVSMFTAQVPESAGSWTVLNNPLFVLAVLAVLALTSVLGPACSTKSESYYLRNSEKSLMGNRLFSWFGFLGADPEKAMDRRMYNQCDIADHYMMEDRYFGADGPLAKYAKGSMGAWAAAGEAAGVIVTAAVYLFVCLKAWAGAFGVGSVTQYVGAVTALSASIGTLVAGLGSLKNNAPHMKNYFTYMDIPHSMYKGSLTTEKRNDRKYDVEFRDVSFRYPGNENWALRHVSIKFRVGSRLAVVGENGSGKTTFIKLLCRLYDPQEGQILLNGIDIRKYRYDDYMDIFSVVFQDFKLISQSLGSNVAGRRDYDRVKVEKALRDAGFDDRMESMPNGLDTQLYKEFDENGVEVSGGEAQKIAIARALYKDAPFIILDEPTAALDPIAEAEIYSRFNEIVTDKTAIYISHRLSSCRFCDEIAVFSGGSIVQFGSHDTLVEAEGKYKDLWNAQAQYYTEEEASR